MNICKFGQNISTGSEDNAWKLYLDISKCWRDLEYKAKVNSFCPPNNVSIQVGQSISTGSEDNAWKLYLDISKCRCDLEYKAKVTKI